MLSNLGTIVQAPPSSENAYGTGYGKSKSQASSALDEELTALLEARWNAHIVRRGPNVVDRNAVKLATLLQDHGAETPNAESAAAAVADTLGIAWRLEAGALEDTATAADDGLPAEQPVAELISELRELAEAAQRAADVLDRPRAPRT